MRVLVTGGGTAGHVTPLVALSAELRDQSPNLTIVFVGFRGDKSLHDSLIDEADFTRVFTIVAGKFRRYYGVPMWRQMLDIPTVFANIRDFFRTIHGTFNSVRIIQRERPDVVFVKGGFVGLPVGLAAKITNTPLVTHDSDTLAGLTNRILSRWASVIATGAPTSFYKYPPNKMVEVGVPVDQDVFEIAKLKQTDLKTELKIQKDRPLLTVVGGTHGGLEINDALIAILPNLLKTMDVIHIAGDSNYKTVLKQVGEPVPAGYRIEKLVDHETLMKYLKASDVVLTRVGASTMAELAILAPNVILIPNPKLTGGHQTKNAKRYHDEEAALVINQTTIVKAPKVLFDEIQRILRSPAKSNERRKNLRKMARPHATKKLAQIILKTGENT